MLIDDCPAILGISGHTSGHFFVRVSNDLSFCRITINDSVIFRRVA